MTQYTYPAIDLERDGIVHNISVYRTMTIAGLNAVGITWDEKVPNVREVTGFNVYRATEEDFILLSSGVGTAFYLDTDDVCMRPGLSPKYKVTCTTSNGESPVADDLVGSIVSDRPSGLQNRLLWPSMEIQRRMSWVTANFGERIKVFVRKRVGIHCPTCWDPLADSPTKAACPDCFGTGFYGGYQEYTGAILLNPAVEKILQADVGKTKMMMPRYYLAPWPIMHSEDILVRQNNERLLVNECTPYLMQFFLLMQEISTTVLAKGHAGWRL